VDQKSHVDDASAIEDRDSKEAVLEDLLLPITRPILVASRQVPIGYVQIALAELEYTKGSAQTSCRTEEGRSIAKTHLYLHARKVPGGVVHDLDRDDIDVLSRLPIVENLNYTVMNISDGKRKRLRLTCPAKRGHPLSETSPQVKCDRAHNCTYGICDRAPKAQQKFDHRASFPLSIELIMWPALALRLGTVT
jgi:hypothetical protein